MCKLDRNKSLPWPLTLMNQCSDGGFRSIFSLQQLEGITSPCCLLIASHDLFAVKDAMESIYRASSVSVLHVKSLYGFCICCVADLSSLVDPVCESKTVPRRMEL